LPFYHFGLKESRKAATESSVKPEHSKDLPFLHNLDAQQAETELDRAAGQSQSNRRRVRSSWLGAFSTGHWSERP
jgi:hypothetical protein